MALGAARSFTVSFSFSSFHSKLKPRSMLSLLTIVAVVSERMLKLKLRLYVISRELTGKLSVAIED